MVDLTDDLDENYELFVQGVIESRLVWGLKSKDGWAVCSSNEFEDAEVYPFWSNENDAQKHCKDEWSDYKSEAIEFDNFIDSWLAGMLEDGILVGANWNKNLEGYEVEPADLAKELLGDAFQSD